jgi:IS4 transposase
MIQASEDEIYNYLNYIEAFQIDRCWRVLDWKYLSELIDSLLKLVEERSWSYESVPVDEVYEELRDLHSM